MNLVCIDPRDIPRVWPFVQGMILAAINKAGVSAFRPVEHKVHAGEMLLWVACTDRSFEAAAVTEVALSERRKLCTIVACGGKKMDNWLHLIKGIERYARLEQCDVMQIIGRKGWARKLPDYRPKLVVLERAL